jgi:uncharacterized protein YuzE
MKIEIDRENNIGYIYIDEKRIAEIDETIQLEGDINVDKAKDGSVIGIEFLNVSEQLKPLLNKKSFSIPLKRTTDKSIIKFLEIL